MEIYKEIVALRKAGVGCAIVTITEAKGSVPRSAGAKMLVKPDGSIIGTVGGGAVEKRLIEEALTALEKGQPKSLHLNLGKELAMSCGGAITAFIEPLISIPQLIIFGAGHIGSALTRLGKMLGFRVIVSDSRSEYANHERLPDADQIFAAPYQDSLPNLKFDENTYVVILTHQHAHDQEILEYCVQKPLAYLGMIGSKTKIKKAFDRLREQDIDEKLIAKIHSPIGLDIGAETPEEIALAIAAELVAVRKGHASNLHIRKKL